METINFMKHVDYFYETIPSIYGTAHFSIHFTDETWIIKEIEDIESQNGEIILGTTDAEDCFKFLQEKNVDVGMFHALLHSKIATEGVLRRMQLKNCEELIGIESIDEQEVAWDEFGSQLLGALEDIKKEAEKKAVKETLRIV